MVESVHSLVVNRLNQHKKYKTSDYKVISSPFDKLNKNMKGFLRGELVLLASRPGMGKTTLAIQLALGFSEHYKVLFNSLDNNKDWMIDKVISQIQGSGFNSVMTGDFLKESFDFVITRAVAPMIDVVKWTRKKYIKEQRNTIENGVIALKGGTLGQELAYFGNINTTVHLSDYFEEDFFKTKKIIHVPINNK